MNSTLFEMWFEKCLLLYLEKGMAIVMNNTSFHRKKQLYEICKKADFRHNQTEAVRKMLCKLGEIGL